MTPTEAMRLYCQTFLRLVETSEPYSDAELALERELDALAPFVFTRLQDSSQERRRQQALAELHAYLMGEDVQLSALLG